MKRKSFIITSNQTSFVLRNVIRFKRCKICKMRFTPDNITGVQSILLNIDGISTNTFLNSSGNYIQYFFMVPFVNNNFASSYSNDLTDTWDYNSSIEKAINSLIITVTNESGVPITMNNSNLIIELLFE